MIDKFLTDIRGDELVEFEDGHVEHIGIVHEDLCDGQKMVITTRQETYLTVECARRGVWREVDE